MDASTAAGAAPRRGLDEARAVGVVLLVAPLALLAVGRGATFAELGGAFSPMFFPTLVLWFWAGVAALSLLADLWRGRATADGAERAPISPARWARIGTVAVLMALFVYGFTRLGFLLSGIGFTALTLLVLGVRSPLLLVAFSVLVPAGLFTMFHHLLGLPLPTSPFSYRF